MKQQASATTNPNTPPAPASADNGSQPLPPLIERVGDHLEAAGPPDDNPADQSLPSDQVVDQTTGDLNKVLKSQDDVDTLPDRTEAALDLVTMRAWRLAQDGVVSSPNNADEVEAALQAVVQVQTKFKQARGVLPDDLDQKQEVLRELDFRQRMQASISWAADEAKQAVAETQNKASVLVRDSLKRLASVAAFVPRMQDMLAPADLYVNGPAQQAVETKNLKEKVRQEVLAEHAAPEPAAPPSATPAQPSVLVVTPPVSAPPVSAPSSAAPAKATRAKATARKRKVKKS